MDEYAFPSGNIVGTIANEWSLHISNLAHTFMSTPCQTNSKADASNRNRQCGYRDWRHPHCPPLPIGSGMGFTTLEHRQLAVLHDALEVKVIVGIATEAEEKRFTFSAENPVGALQRKQHMNIFSTGDRGHSMLRTSRVNYCAYGGHYMKNTHMFHNMPGYQPKGTSGNGLCAKKGNGIKVPCPAGHIVEGKFLHYYTIGRESSKEFVTEKVSRRKGKNAIPTMLTSEMTCAALDDWCKHNKQQQSRKRKTSVR